jgi:signal transduction histidine kinase
MNAMLARLEQATNRQRQFVADASHELRSPLTGMRTHLEVGLAHPENADWKTTGQQLLDDTIRLQRLVDDLLALARTDSTAGPSERTAIDLDDIVLSEARRIRALSPISVDTSGVSGAQLEGSPHDLTRAVRNLLDNAARHAHERVTVTLEESDATVFLTITDDGTGIPLGANDQIFERFTRLDDARARDAGGAGLGLAIVNAVVEAHGGAVAVDNVPGARFTIRLPVGPDRAPRRS